MNERVLLVEDSESLAALYQSYLEPEGYRVTSVENGRDAMIQLLRNPPNAILLDLQLPDMHGMEILKKIAEQQIPSAVVIITAHGSVDMAVTAMQSGAYDFLVKPFDAKRLLTTLRNAIANQQLKLEVADYRENFKRHHFEGFIGESIAMQGVYKIIESAAPSNATVFITGESGTGKEVCSTAIHQRSPRAKGPFIPLNCGAIPKELMESEIFGHVKGAFTGAQSAREGAATQANGGTLFLDEICEMDLELQTKLLRFIQTGSFQKVGGSQLEKVDVRFVCATNKDPLAEVGAGRFREDLYYRLHVIPIHLPPLRERDTDVKLIMESLLKKYAKEERKDFQRFSKDATQTMMRYTWPGNVRQLQNIIRNIVVLNNADQVAGDMIPAPVSSPGQNFNGDKTTQDKTIPQIQQIQNQQAPTLDNNQSSGIRPLWIVEKEAIEQAITACDGNIPRAAALLDVSASTIYRKKEKWDAEG